MRRLMVLIMIFVMTIQIFADPSRIAILYLQTEKADETDAKIIYENLKSSLFLSNVFIVVERDNLDTILHEQELQNSGVISEDNAVRIGKILATDYLLYGKYSSISNSKNIVLNIASVETGRIVASISDSFPDTTSLLNASNFIVLKLLRTFLNNPDFQFAMPIDAPKYLNIRLGMTYNECLAKLKLDTAMKNIKEGVYVIGNDKWYIYRKDAPSLSKFDSNSPLSSYKDNYIIGEPAILVESNFTMLFAAFASIMKNNPTIKIDSVQEVGIYFNNNVVVKIRIAFAEIISGKPSEDFKIKYPFLFDSKLLIQLVKQELRSSILENDSLSIIKNKNSVTDEAIIKGNDEYENILPFIEDTTLPQNKSKYDPYYHSSFIYDKYRIDISPRIAIAWLENNTELYEELICKIIFSYQ